MEEGRNEATYSANTRIGNWNEDLFMEDEKLKQFLRKRERNELLVQKSRQLFCNILKEVELAVPSRVIKFGDIVQVVAPDMPATADCIGKGLALSGVIGEKEVDAHQELADGCDVTFSNCLVPCVRNTYIIACPDNSNRNGDILTFGQDFLLQCSESFLNIPVYVTSPTMTLTLNRSHCDHQGVQLSCKLNSYVRWRVNATDKSIRQEVLGAHVPANTRVLITHGASNKHLAVEFGSWAMTFFGSECGATCHTYLNSHKRETAENLFVLRIQGSKTGHGLEGAEEEK